MKDEQKLVLLARRGDHKAFTKLYDFYCDRIYAFIASRVDSMKDAEDLTALTWEKAVLHIRYYSSFDFNI